MKFHIFAAATASVAASFLAAHPAAALKLSVTPTKTAIVGQSQSFQLAATEATGVVNVRWNFGDGTITDLSSATQATHTYKDAGHYTVIAQGTDDVGRAGASFIQTAANPLTDKKPSNSSSIILDNDLHQLWNVNPDSDTVTVIDAVKRTRVREVPVGHEPHTVAMAPDQTVWVTNQRSDEIVVLNRMTGAIETRIALPYASQPRALAFGNNGLAYVSLFATGQLVEIDGTTRKVTRELSVGPTPAGVSVAADGRIFVTRFISPVDHGEVWVVSPQTFKVANTIILPFDEGPDTQSSGRGVPNYVASMVISPDGTQAWVSAKKDDTARGRMRDGLPMTADNFVRPAVCTIDMKTEKEIIEKRQDIDNRSLPVSVVFSPIGDYAFVLVETSNWIGIMDAYTTQSVTGIRDVGNAPDGLVLAPDGTLYVNAFLSREVIAYDVNTSLSSSDHTAPEPLARIRTIDQEPLTAQLLLGKQIFYNAADTRMGHAGYWSCASCHFGGVTDGRVWDFTDRGEGLRNTKTLLGIRGAQGEGRVHWSANMDEIQDFERDIRQDFGGSGFMPQAEFDARKLPDGNYDTLGKKAAGTSKELDALAAYITSLDKVMPSPFRNADGSFTADAIAGQKIFASSGCPVCHNGPDFTDSANGILHDVGTLLATSGMRLGGKLTGIDTPSLKGAWQSAPYLHDGRAETLADIFIKYNRGDGMGTTSNLSPTEINQLASYLQQLDDVPVTEPTATPADTPSSGASSGAGKCSTSRAGGPASAGVFGTWIAASCALIGLRRRRAPRVSKAAA